MRKNIILIAIALSLVPSVWYLTNLPDVSQLKLTNPTTSAIRSFRERQTKKKGGKPQSQMVWRDLDQISPHLWHAVITAEDDGFFQHSGFDVLQLKKAARTNWERKSFAFGASTLTQQLARTLYLSPSKNLLRKAKEALITRQMEKSLPKKRILELYLNTVEWGPQIYGAETAAQYFFNKPASDLTPDEAIALAVILPSPRKWNPRKEDGFLGKRKSILYERMVRANYIEPPVSPDITESTEPLVLPPISVDQPTSEEPAPLPTATPMGPAQNVVPYEAFPVER